MNTLNNCTEIVIEPTGDQPKIRFNGDLVARVSSQRRDSYLWTEMEAYRTRAGKWVFVKIGAVNEDLTDKERRVSVLVFEDAARMTLKLGYGRLAAKLYEKMGLEEVFVA